MNVYIVPHVIIYFSCYLVANGWYNCPISIRCCKNPFICHNVINLYSHVYIPPVLSYLDIRLKSYIKPIVYIKYLLF